MNGITDSRPKKNIISNAAGRVRLDIQYAVILNVWVREHLVHQERSLTYVRRK